MTPLGARHLGEAVSLRPERVAIAGGGIGGMALALSLHAAGSTEINVYESARSVMELGADQCAPARHTRADRARPAR